MTKKNVNTVADLPIRARGVDPEPESAMYVHDPDFTTDIPTFVPDHAHMHHFGPGINTQFFPSGYNILLPCTTPTLQFPAPDDSPEDELPLSPLFYSYVSAELNAEGVRFDEYVDPFAHDVIVDENGQPQRIAPGAGKYTDHIWEVVSLTRAIEPDRVPVYPRRPQPYTFSPPPSQECPLNPFGVQQVSARPVASKRSKPPLLLPKGNRMPPAAAVETFDTAEPNLGRGRKRPLSPDSRAAAREVRIMHACARCRRKRERVSSYSYLSDVIY
jgi:hypothetical protein